MIKRHVNLDARILSSCSYHLISRGRQGLLSIIIYIFQIKNLGIGKNATNCDFINVSCLIFTPFIRHWIFWRDQKS